MKFFLPENFLKSLLYLFPLFIIALMGLILMSNTINNKSIFYDIYNFTRTYPSLNLIFKFLAVDMIFILALGAVVFAIFKRNSYGLSLIIYLFLVTFISYIISRVTTHYVIDIRPYIEYHFNSLVRVSHDNGFPSDHTLISFDIALTVFVYSRKIGSIFILFACLIAFSRIYVFAHHPLDIFGGVLISYITVSLCYPILRKLNKYYFRKYNK